MTAPGRQRRASNALPAAYNSGSEANRAIENVSVNHATRARHAPTQFNAALPLRPAATGVDER